MKRLVFVLFLLVSGVVNSQSNSDFNNWFENTKSFKRIGNERLQTLGLLKTLLTDSSTRYQYEKINPVIGELLVDNHIFTEDDELEPFNKWIKTLPVYDSTYKITYKYNQCGKNNEGDILSNESIKVYDINNKVVYSVVIYYDNDNFRSICNMTGAYNY